MLHTSESAGNPLWQNDKVALKTINVFEIPEESSLAAAVRTGSVDMAVNVSPNQAKPLTDGGFQVKSANIGSTMAVWINVAHEPDNSPLRNKSVRQALNYAIDKQGLLKSIYQGYGKELNGQMLGPDAFGYDSSLQPYPYDPAKAKQLLASAGVPNGFATTLAVITPSLSAVGEPLQGMWQQIGVKVGIVPYTLAVSGQKTLAGTLDPLYVTTLSYAPIPDADVTLQRFSNIFPQQTWLWGNTDYNQLYVASSRELDQTKRLALLHQAEALMREEAAVVYLLQPAVIYGLSTKVSGFEPRSDQFTFFDKLSKTG